MASFIIKLFYGEDLRCVTIDTENNDLTLEWLKAKNIFPKLGSADEISFKYEVDA